MIYDIVSWENKRMKRKTEIVFKDELCQPKFNMKKNQMFTFNDPSGQGFHVE